MKEKSDPIMLRRKIPIEDRIARLEKEDGKEIRRVIVRVVGPVLAETVLQTILQMLVMIMVGGVGAAAVAAVGLTNQPVLFALAVFTAFNVGTTAIVARSIGAGDYEQANRTAQQTFIVNLLLSVVFSILGFLFAEPLLIILQAEPEVLAEGVAYARIMLLSVAFTVVSLSLSAALRGAGDTKTPFKINVLSNVLVVVIGFPLIYGYWGLPELGLLGAAYSALAARLISTLWVIHVIFSGKTNLKLSWGNIWIFDWRLVARILKIGLPSAGEQFTLRFGHIIFTVVVAGLGTSALAAHTISYSIMDFSFLPGMAFAIAGSTLVGQGLGAKKPELAERFGWETCRLGCYIAGIMGAAFILFAPYIMAIYTRDSDVIELGTITLRIIGLVQVSNALQFILAGALRGAGDTKIPFYSMIIGVLGFRSVLCILFVLGFQWGILGAYLALAVDIVVRSFIILYRFKHGRWKKAAV